MYLIKISNKSRENSRVRQYLRNHGIKTEGSGISSDWTAHHIYIDVSEEDAILIKLTFNVDIKETKQQINEPMKLWASSMGTGKSNFVSSVMSSQASGIHPIQSKTRLVRFTDFEATFKDEYLVGFFPEDTNLISKSAK